MKRRAGFSFIEALVALVISGIVLLMASQFLGQFSRMSSQIEEEVLLRDQMTYAMTRLATDCREADGVHPMRDDAPLAANRVYLYKRLAKRTPINFGETQRYYIEYGLNENTRRTAEDRLAGAYVVYRSQHKDTLGRSDRQPLNAGMTKEGFQVRYLDENGQETAQADLVTALEVELVGRTPSGKGVRQKQVFQLGR
ncbi:type II secretion system protein J [Peptococcus simiae]|uniref:Type II secretion system protein J n=1 Tax=Peptococcus simiae TaxID=1643805 RepID=A0ABW9H1E0_9FIRM